MKPDRSGAYALENGCFTVTNGINRYGRPLYGRYGRFHVYAGDRPEWAMSRPGKTGNLLIGIRRGAQRKWLIQADSIRAEYCPGFYRHVVRDRLLGSAVLTLTSVAMIGADGLLVAVSIDGNLAGTEIVWAFGGVREIESCVSKDFDTCGYSHESHFFPWPEDSEGNSVKIAGATFVLTVPFVLGSPQQPTAVQYTGKLYQGEYAGVTGAATGGQRLKAVHARIFGEDMALSGQLGSAPAVMGSFRLKPGETVHLGVMMMAAAGDRLTAASLPTRFTAALRHHEAIRNQVTVRTPDTDLNTMVPALAAAMDTVWDPPYIVHGGIHCHSPFLGWRHAYGATTFGWWDRAASHFRTFAKTQHRKTPPGCDQPRMDEANGLARQAKESILYSRGFIWGHRDGPEAYNMQEVMVDMLFRHLLYSGDRQLAREMFPVLERHLAWEKRCFDPDHDGLYENFANTHISDAHSYNGAGCTQASAYTYYANRMMARLAEFLGRDGAKYAREAVRIRTAMNRVLWMKDQGAYAECRDLIGRRQRHESPELPSVYHPIDSGTVDPFQAWQMLDYTRRTYEHVRCGLDRGWMVWSSNWVPWFWSTRQLMLNETSHLALAAWQAGGRERAYEYLLGGLLNSMAETKCPGGAIGTSPLDRHHPGLATDFPCGTGMACRALIEGLFGIQPDRLANRLLLRPGFPAAWDFASIKTPYVEYEFKRNQKEIRFTGRLPKAAAVRLELPWGYDRRPRVTVNGRPARVRVTPGIGTPMLTVDSSTGTAFDIVIHISGNRLEFPVFPTVAIAGSELALNVAAREVKQFRDPQGCIADSSGNRVRFKNLFGGHTFFVLIRRNQVAWWQPVTVELRPPFEFLHPEYCKHTNAVHCRLRNNLIGTDEAMCIPLKTAPSVPGMLSLKMPVRQQRHRQTLEIKVPAWNLVEKPAPDLFQPLDISSHMNLDIEFMFQQKYRSPRSPYCSLQLPETGYGEWCSGSHRTPPLLSSLYFSRRVDGRKRFHTPQGIPFHSPNWKWHNAVMTSQWDNFPAKVVIPVAEFAAERLYFLVAGSANPMYSQMNVGLITVACTDGQVFRLPLHSPGNFWPIWGDFDRDADAFCLPENPPQRVLIGENTWANLLDLDTAGRKIARVEFACLANETVIGLLGITAFHS